VPATVQGTVNGQALRVQVVLDLQPPADRHIRSFVMQDVAPLMQRLRAAAARGRASPSGAADACPAAPSPPTPPHPAPALPPGFHAAPNVPSPYAHTAAAEPVRPPSRPPLLAAPAPPGFDMPPGFAQRAPSPFAGSALPGCARAQVSPLLSGFAATSIGCTPAVGPSARPSAHLGSLFSLAAPTAAAPREWQPSSELEAAMQRLWAEPPEQLLRSVSPAPPRGQQRTPLYARGGRGGADSAAAHVFRSPTQTPIGSVPPRPPPGFDARGAGDAACSARDPVVRPSSMPSAVGPIGSGSSGNLASHLPPGISASHL